VITVIGSILKTGKNREFVTLSLLPVIGESGEQHDVITGFGAPRRT